MPSLFFTNTLMLAGMAALAIPLVIHLLLKRKKKRVQFSTVRFFLEQNEQSSRRRKLRNFFLLALRLLIVALLVLAFSRPYSRQSEASAAGRKQRRVVFVIDHSASMLATGTEGQRWPLAKEHVLQALAELSSDDAAALVECATHANVLSGFCPPAKLAQLVRDLPPSYGDASLADGLREAVRLLSDRASSSVSTIYVVSDFQKSACRGLNASPVPPQIEVKPLSGGDIFSPNIAITSIQTDAADAMRPRATVASFSDEESTDATLEVKVDGQSVSSQSLSIKAGALTNVDLAIPAFTPGWHDVTAIIHAKDALEVDNARYACLWVPQPARVLVVEPRSAAHVFEQETFFLSAALNPSMDPTNPAPGPFSLTQITPDELSERLGSPPRDGGWNVVILPATKELPVGVGSALNTFVKAGGGLVLFLGQGMSANRINAELADLLPARIGDDERSPETGSPWRIALYDTNALVFAAFRTQNSGDLRIPEFLERRALAPVEGSTRLSFFDDGVPLVIARSLGKGRVVLVNTSADTAWNDWPKHKTFVPFVHGLTMYSAQGFHRNSSRASADFVAGEDADLDTGAEGQSARFTLKSPDGRGVQLTADEHGRLRDPAIGIPGVYSLQDQTGRELQRIAVNVPSPESNLEAFRPAEFLQQLPRVQDNPKQTLAAGLFGARTDQREFWTALLLGALILLLVEPFIANRTSV